MGAALATAADSGPLKAMPAAAAATPATSRQAQFAPADRAAFSPDRAVVDLIAREVIGRVEKQIRIERERRGT